MVGGGEVHVEKPMLVWWHLQLLSRLNETEKPAGAHCVNYRLERSGMYPVGTTGSLVDTRRSSSYQEIAKTSCSGGLGKRGSYE